MNALGLGGHSQDWGIENADPARVREFVAFFERHYDEHWSAFTVAEYFDLVMESASDALRLQSLFRVSIVDGFVAKASALAPERLTYWISDEWPVAQHLRQLVLRPSV